MRQKLRGTSERPRLYIFRSNKHIYAQIIDDSTSKTLMTKSSISTDIKTEKASSVTCAVAKRVGTLIGKACLSQGINKVVFDRGDKRYHGRLKALAESAREEGIQF
uniref:Large ribosomal subunit protein uL18c n=1 Tax=Liagoropsis maxima TaxID=1653392 RepID=A0A1G4NVY8_9FLOR|nr:Ribosomal protein L18 [Liagoropsis maxima]SCW22832.1 Ribosomal protein L18 [Liagoropsis maxima]